MSMAAKSSLRPRLPVRTKLYTYDELCAQMEETNQPHELWDGELIMSPAPFWFHQEVLLRFYRSLFDWVTPRRLGKVVASPIDMVLSPHRMVQPDVAYISKENLGRIQNVIMGPADLVAEVLSPGGRRRDRVDKKDLYEQHGVREYWIIDPEAQSVDVLSLSAGLEFTLVGRFGRGEVAVSVLLPGFSIDAARLFAADED